MSGPCLFGGWGSGEVSFWLTDHAVQPQVLLSPAVEEVSDVRYYLLAMLLHQAQVLQLREAMAQNGLRDEVAWRRVRNTDGEGRLAEDDRGPPMKSESAGTAMLNYVQLQPLGCVGAEEGAATVSSTFTHLLGHSPQQGPNKSARSRGRAQRPRIESSAGCSWPSAWGAAGMVWPARRGREEKEGQLSATLSIDPAILGCEAPFCLLCLIALFPNVPRTCPGSS